MLRIGTGTRSLHKVGAIEAACELVGVAADISGSDAESKVPDQPIGFAQTRRGATNRAQSARAAHPDLDVWIGIESGILEDIDDSGGSVAIDLAVIVILFGTQGGVVYATSTGITFPKRDVIEWHAGGRRGTVGDVIARRTGGSNTDPHAALTGGRLTRHTTLVDGVKAALLQLPIELLRK